jgi:hypothetical protein
MLRNFVNFYHFEPGGMFLGRGEYILSNDIKKCMILHKVLGLRFLGGVLDQAGVFAAQKLISKTPGYEGKYSDGSNKNGNKK